MVRLLLDADATIELYRSAVLADVVASYSCEMPTAVYEEVLTRGKARLHQDAQAIELIIGGTVTITAAPERQRSEIGLGAGELGILDLVAEDSECVVVSDDRRFLSLLSVRRIPFLTPVNIVVLLAKQAVISRLQAREALEHLRPLVRGAAYEEAKEELRG